MGKFRYLIFVLATIIIVSIPSIVYASYGYDYARTSDLNYSDDGVRAANSCWNYLGYTYSSYIGSSFTKSRFLNNCASGNGVYANTHGNSDVIQDNGSGYIYRSEVSTRRSGDWKRLVFLDACDTADNSNWASAWGIANGDGSLHAFIGWFGCAYDNSQYRDFTANFWDWVAGGYTIRQALSRGSAVSGVTNYRYYGNIDWDYY